MGAAVIQGSGGMSDNTMKDTTPCHPCVVSVAAAGAKPRAGDGAVPSANTCRPLEDILTQTLYADLRRYAAMILRREPSERSLHATALVHEAIVRLKATGGEIPEDRGRFFALASTVLRHVLVDRARHRRSLKRGGDGRVGARTAGGASLEGVAATAGPDDATILAIDEALDRLEKLDGRKARVVMLRYFGGLGVEETARALGVSPRTVESDWRSARAWLARELAGLAL